MLLTFFPSNAQLSAAEYCECLEFDRKNCFCGPHENMVMIYCDGGKTAKELPKLRNTNPASCRLAECNIALVFEHYRVTQIPDDIIADLIAHQPCLVRFALRHNPELVKISPNAFAIDATASLKELHIENTGLKSMSTIATAIKRTYFDCKNGHTIVSFANNAINDFLDPDLTHNLKCVNALSLNNNPQIHIALLALNRLNLTQLGLSNTSINQLYGWHFKRSQIKNLDLSGNPQLLVKNWAGTEERGIVENLMVSTSADMSGATGENDSFAPTKHFVCSTNKLECHCLDVSKSQNKKTLNVLLTNCNEDGNACIPGCDNSMFHISEGVEVPYRFKRYLQLGNEFDFSADPADMLEWYILTDDANIKRLNLDSSDKYKYIFFYLRR